MTKDLIFANATVVLERECVRGSVRISDGVIADVDQGTAVPVGATDCGGAMLIPGLVELHTDNLERHLSPRPRVNWPHAAAIAAHDSELASVGITTVFDALRVGSVPSSAKRSYGKYARGLADEILEMRAAGALKISHHLHLRAEICSETLIEELAEFGPDDRVGILSLMDHMPGQRQFTDISKYEAYVCSKYGLSQADFAEHVDHLYAIHAKLGVAHEAAAVEAAHGYGAVLASHDDTTEAQVQTSARHGVQLAEFPTTQEAARSCHDNDVLVMMGAPNLIRGGSHSGNVAAKDLADVGLLDVLSSDYVPASLLAGAVKLGRQLDDMSAGIRAVTWAPAQASKLLDRGKIEVGQRADLVRLRAVGDMLLPDGVWVEGCRVS